MVRVIAGRPEKVVKNMQRKSDRFNVIFTLVGGVTVVVTVDDSVKQSINQ